MSIALSEISKLITLPNNDGTRCYTLCWIKRINPEDYGEGGQFDVAALEKVLADAVEKFFMENH